LIYECLKEKNQGKVLLVVLYHFFCPFSVLFI
jgi:hypothetical protein